MKNILFMCVFASIISCNSSKDAQQTNNTETTKEITTAVEKCIPIIQDRKAAMTAKAKSPDFLISAVRPTQNGCFDVEISYTGCDEDTFGVYWNGAVMKSMPPRATLFMRRAEGGDCKKKVQKTVSFDCAPMSIHGKKMMITVNDFKEMVAVEFE